MLEIKNVTKIMDQRPILNGCTLKVESGSILGLIGMNGAGKSTLLRCISGIYHLDAGLIIWNHESIYENPKVKNQIMYLSDDIYLGSGFSIKQLKDFYRNFYPTFYEKDYRDNLKKFALDENMVLRKLSKGMQRQAYIVVILAFKPKLLILDESFDGLDPVAKKQMKQAIIALVSDNQTTVIISSHSLSDIESICDHVAIISNGTITSTESLDENKDNYHRYQLAFDRHVVIEEFSKLEIIDISIKSQFVTLIVKGTKTETLNLLNSLQPVLIEEMDLSLNDLFIAKMKGSKHYV